MIDYVPGTEPRTNGRRLGGRKPVPAGETKSGKFVRLAIARMTMFKHRARQVKNLAAYDFSLGQADQVVAECQKAVDDIRNAFHHAQTRGKNQDAFRFDVGSPGDY